MLSVTCVSRQNRGLLAEQQAARASPFVLAVSDPCFQARTMEM
jgi:hypothetical protein